MSHGINHFYPQAGPIDDAAAALKDLMLSMSPTIMNMEPLLHSLQVPMVASGNSIALLQSRLPNNSTLIRQFAGKMMTDEFPKQCNKFFDGPASVNGFAMTGYNDSFLYDGCSLTEQQENGRNKTFHRAGGDVSFLNQLDLDEDDQTVLYSNLTQLVYPVMTVFMPIADIEAKNSIGTVIPHMTCAHVNHISEYHGKIRE